MAVLGNQVGRMTELLEGLSLAQKTISPKFLYDSRGSELFDEICGLPEYYLTRAESEILRTHVGDIARILSEQGTMVELGSGKSDKTRLILEAVAGRITYVPIDISRETLLESTRRLLHEFPRLKLIPMCADFLRIERLPLDRPALVFFPGSTIGNLDPEEALALLVRLSALAGRSGHLVVGVDLVKDARRIEAAYNDAQGVTAAFNRNVLLHLNREHGAAFDPDEFEHLAFFNPEKSRIEMHLVSQREQLVRVGEARIRLLKGETIHTESSYKYEAGAFAELLGRAGFAYVERWTDSDALYAVFHAACGP
jgi:dimethylhistidine N-methyltransferase